MGGNDENGTNFKKDFLSNVCPEFFNSCILLADLSDHHLSDLRISGGTLNEKVKVMQITLHQFFNVS